MVIDGVHVRHSDLLFFNAFANVEVPPLDTVTLSVGVACRCNVTSAFAAPARCGDISYYLGIIQYSSVLSHVKLTMYTSQSQH